MSLSNFTPKGKSGFVYLLKSGDYYKIGLTTGDLKQRISSMQTGNPVPIKLVAFFETDDVVGDESYLHDKFRDYRVQGEWFSFPKELIDCKDAWFRSCSIELPQPQATQSLSAKPKPCTANSFTLTEDEAQKIMNAVEERNKAADEANRRNALNDLLAFAKNVMTPEEYAKVERQHR